MNDKSFIKLAVFMLVFCLVCQIIAMRLLNHSKLATNLETGMAVGEKPSQEADSSSEKNVSRQLDRQNKKLIKLDNQEDFLRFTSNEMEVAKLFKIDREGSHYQYYTATMGIDINHPDLQEAVRKLINKREEFLQKDLDELEAFVAEADLSCLTDEEYDLFTQYLDDRREWARIAYDDSVDNETKLEVCKAWAEVDRSGKIRLLTEKIYQTQYGDVYDEYMAEYNAINIDQLRSYTNPWWINRTVAWYKDADGNRRTLRVKLFMD